MSKLEPTRTCSNPTATDELKPCPFCGSKALYEVYHNLDGFDVPVMFCNWCKAMFTVEGSEDWVGSGSHDGMAELRAAWNRRADWERVVRCRDCANAAECEDGTLDCHGALVQTWDYYNDEPLRNPVPPNGFCAWGVRRAES